ncbi:unnamed protein product [Phyllotreta striolata]|uniref:Uncharacterized protein n=1 Tax=Phyllotreta striolata TaxID=444603 RepID=A0A9N9TKA9_PHYSR|nr:unnamed protein product [Phyllotreta striolata]
MQNDSPDGEREYDGLVVQSYNSAFDQDKIARYEKIPVEHVPGCMLSAFLYFITITTFVYLTVLWIKQRMHVQVEQMQWW